MIKAKSLKALEIIRILEEKTGEKISIYKGIPYAESIRGYHAYSKKKGDKCKTLYKSSTSLDGLID